MELLFASQNAPPLPETDPELRRALLDSLKTYEEQEASRPVFDQQPRVSVPDSAGRGPPSKAPTTDNQHTCCDVLLHHQSSDDVFWCVTHALIAAAMNVALTSLQYAVLRKEVVQWSGKSLVLIHICRE